jgi:hypothetical protein
LHGVVFDILVGSRTARPGEGRIHTPRLSCSRTEADTFSKQ